MTGKETAVILRSHNDMPLIADTLAMLARQTHPFHLIALDNSSTDGTLEELKKYTDHIIDIPTGTYVPGPVLNRGMEEAAAYDRYVAFLNSDCTPADENWLEELLKGFTDDSVCAVFGRQMPRPDCKPLFAKDTDDTYGDGSRQKYWRHCFSMASSAIDRTCWEESPFRSDIQYSEDIDWTWRARQRGWKIVYAKDSKVYHSHNYSWKAFRKRHYGEGRAEAVIFPWSKWEQSFLRYSLLPYLRQVKSDWGYAVSHRSPAAFFHSPVIRMAQLLGRRKGFREGLRELKRGEQ